MDSNARFSHFLTSRWWQPLGLLIAFGIGVLMGCQRPPAPSSSPTATATLSPTSPITVTPPTQALQRPPDVPPPALSRRVWGTRRDWAEIWDYPAEAAHQRARIQGGDFYAMNVYERPADVTMNYLPDLDLQYARLERVGSWYVLTISLAGLRPGATAPQGNYGIEIDLDRDGRGEQLFWVEGPITSQEWDPNGVYVYQDLNGDVGGQHACRSDAPFPGTGYEKQLTPSPGHEVWVRWQPGKQHPLIYLAFRQSWIPEPARFLWQVWATAQEETAQRMDIHDRYTPKEAGSPYHDSPFYPLRAVAQVDSTCRTTFGFAPTGSEPCLCQDQDPLHLVCPVPEQPPTPECDLEDGQWVCPDPEGEDSPLYCTWDPELCTWDCKPDPICLPPQIQNADELGERVPPKTDEEVCYWTGEDWVCSSPEAQPRFEATEPGTLVRTQTEGESVTVCTWDTERCRWVCNRKETFDEFASCQEEAATPSRYLEEVAQPILRAQGGSTFQVGYFCPTGQSAAEIALCQLPALTVADAQPQCALPFLPNGFLSSPATQGTVFCLSLSNESTSSAEGLRECTYQADSCRWVCRTQPRCTTEAPTQPPASNCTFQEETNAWLCGEGEMAQRCTWQAASCGWQCNPVIPTCSAEASQRPEEVLGSDADCTWDEIRERWLCSLPLMGSTTCQWDAEACTYTCQSCQVENETCAYDEERERWVCPGLGEFEQCQWSETACRWKCTQPYLPPTTSEDGGAACQAENSCSYDSGDGHWYCDSGGPYNSCSYDGCTWNCN